MIEGYGKQRHILYPSDEGIGGKYRDIEIQIQTQIRCLIKDVIEGERFASEAAG